MTRLPFDLFDTFTWTTRRPSGDQTEYTLEQEIADSRERSLARSRQVLRERTGD